MTWTNPTPARMAADFIASQRAGPDDDACGHLAQFMFGPFSKEVEPELIWDSIVLVLETYSEADLYAETMSEAQEVCGVLAAGPLEDLLSIYGEQFIEKCEDFARRDRRMAWLLGGVWQFQMTDEIWSRVQTAADHSFWTRQAS